MTAYGFLFLVTGILLSSDEGLSIMHLPRSPLFYNRNRELDLEANVGLSGRKPQDSEGRVSDLQKIRMKNIQGMENELKAMLWVDFKWEQSLLHAPTVVSAIEQLMILAGKRHMKIFKEGFSSSFGYTAQQIADEAETAFRLADENMLGIRQRIYNMKNHLREVSKYLRSDNLYDIEEIEKSSASCAQDAKEMDTSFIQLIKLLGKMNEALLGADGNPRGLLNITHKRKTAEEEGDFAKTTDDEVKREFEKVSELLEEDRVTYKKALGRVPVGWEGAFIDMVRGLNPMQIAGLFMGNSGPLSCFSDEAMTAKRGNKSADVPDSARLPNDALITDDNLNQEYALNRAENVFRGISRIVPELEDFLELIEDRVSLNEDMEVHWDALIDFLTAKRIGAEELSGTLAIKGDSPWKEDVMDLLDLFIEETNSVISADMNAKTIGSSSKDMLRSQISRFKDLQTETEVLLSIRGFRSGSISSRRHESTMTPSGSLRPSSDAERYIAAQRQSALDETQRRYERYYESVTKASKESSNTPQRASLLAAKSVKPKDIRTILDEGISAIGKMRKVFGQLHRLFQATSGVAGVTLTKATKSLISDARELTDNPDNPYYGLLDTLAVDPSRVDQVLTAILTLSDVYRKMYGNYILDHLAMVPALQVEANIQNLFLESERAQADMMKTAELKRAKFHQLVAKSNSEIEEMFKLLGKPTDDEKGAIESAKAIIDMQIKWEDAACDA